MDEERQRISLFTSPLRTLYYFGRFAGGGLSRGFQWVLVHPFTLFILLPALAVYVAVKQGQLAPELVAYTEVGVSQLEEEVQGVVLCAPNPA